MWSPASTLPVGNFSPVFALGSWSWLAMPLYMRGDEICTGARIDNWDFRENKRNIWMIVTLCYEPYALCTGPCDCRRVRDAPRFRCWSWVSMVVHHPVCKAKCKPEWIAIGLPTAWPFQWYGTVRSITSWICWKQTQQSHRCSCHWDLCLNMSMRTHAWHRYLGTRNTYVKRHPWP